MGSAGRRWGIHGLVPVDAPTWRELCSASAPTGGPKTGNCKMGTESGQLWPPEVATRQAALQGLSPLAALPRERESAAGKGFG